MAKKVFSSKNLDIIDLLDALESRNVIRLKPPVREANQASWDALTGALLMKRCDLIVQVIGQSGKHYQRIRHSDSTAAMTVRLKGAAIEYVIRTGASTPKWVPES